MNRELVRARMAFVVRLSLALLILAGAPLAAQGPPPGTPAGKPWSDAMVAESLAVLQTLDRHVQAKPRDAAAWYRRAMIAWGLMYRDKIGPPYKGVDWTSLGRNADSSMRIAYQLDSRNPRYVLSAAQYFLGSGQMAMRLQSYPMFGRALTWARQGPDKAFLAEALIESGRLSWRRYDALANRRIPLEGADVVRSLDAFLNTVLTFQRNEVIANINDVTQPLVGEFSGTESYERAEALFREAYEAVPTDARAFRQIAMVLAERKRWNELASHARTHLSRVSNDAPALFALGLSLQRTRRTVQAQAVFDTALAAIDAQERAHVTNLKRVLAPGNAKSFAAMPTTQQINEDRSYWLFNDPLWSRDGNDAQTEFLARAAFADIRWTVEELGVRGLDSDRGEFHVRYGPPDLEAQIGPAPDRSEYGGGLSVVDSTKFAGRPSPVGSGSFSQGDAILDVASLATVWAYKSGTVIIFRGAPTFGTARIPPNDQSIVDSIVHATPANWGNVAEERIEEMPTQVSRFRATRDSVDVFIATEPPVAEMRRMTASNAPVHLAFWLFGQTVPDTYRDSTSVARAEPQTWLYRVRPAEYGYRIESTADGALLAGKSTASVDARDTGTNAFARSGFGMSDLLLASRVRIPPTARRWDDLDFDAIGGTVTARSSVVLIWENYDFGDDGGSAKYGVKLTIRRQYEHTVNRIRARIIGSMAAMVGVEETEDRVIHRFERSVPHAPTMVDNLTVDLNDSPLGDYFLTLEITDRVTGRVTERERRIVIR